MNGKMENQGASSEGEHSEEAIKEVKKPRLVESSETKEEANDIEIFEEENFIEEDEKKKSEELSEEKMGDKDHTEGLKEGVNILQVLLDMHEGVPLEDPGPNIASEDRGEGVAGATQ